MTTRFVAKVGLALRSLLWTLLLPGMVAGYIPWRFFGLSMVPFNPGRPAHVTGLFLIALGVVLLVVCVWGFAHSGQGTLSPADPPRHLVVTGLYRYVRNPMYLSVTTVVLGEALLAESAALGVYWAGWFLLVNLFVVGYEEPTLARRFGPDYREYRRQVRRWVPRVRPWRKGTAVT
jgi:protein-S-isoprenylcysteine O-methyltransferase Ste14